MSKEGIQGLKEMLKILSSLEHGQGLLIGSADKAVGKGFSNLQHKNVQ